MAKPNFEAVMEQIFRHEGGYVNHPSDPGGETNFGITKRTYPKVHIRSLTKGKARDIYRRDFWNKIRGDDLPHGIDLVTMDPAVNSGVSRGVRWMQKAMKVTADGKVGPQTIRASQDADPVETIKRACANRMGFLRGLRTWTTFGKGWSRRVAEVEAVSIRMALAAGGGPARPTLVDEHKKAKTSAKADNAAGGASVATGGGSAVGADQLIAGLPEWAPWVIAAVLLVVAIQFVGRARHQTERAIALQDAAIGAKS